MNAWISTLVYLSVLLQSNFIEAQLQCGKLSVEQVYHGDSAVALDEFPWFGRIFYYGSNSDEKVYRCNAVLINERYMLLPAHCATNRDERIGSVLLGDWNTTNANNEADCDADGVCAPPPEFYDVESVIIYPDFNPRQHQNDIAIIKLTKDVKFSEYVQPICLPNAEQSNEKIPEYLVYGGFARKIKHQHDAVESEKLKAVAHIVDKATCIQKVEKYRTNITDEQICATLWSDFSFLSGSALMGVNFVENKPHNYYLIGLVNRGSTAKTENSIDFFVRTSSYLDWIKSSIK